MEEILLKVGSSATLSIQEQVDYMKYKGITFNYISEDEAKVVLSDNSYYYKLTAYRKNFLKNDEGKYENLDFKNLSDLAIIDMRLRYFIMKLTLDIEHSIKTQLVNAITEGNIDCHSIVNDYNTYQKKFFKKRIDERDDLNNLEKDEMKTKYIDVVKNIMGDYSNPKGYDYDLYSKQIANPSIWVLLELMTFGKLSSFVKFYTDKNYYKSSYFIYAKTFLPHAKNIRNCAAHSRPVILHIDQGFQFDKTGKPLEKNGKPRFPKKPLSDFVRNRGIEKSVAYTRLSNKRIHDIASVLYLHDTYVQSIGIKKNRKLEFNEILERCKREKNIYTENKYFSEIYEMLALLM